MVDDVWFFRTSPDQLGLLEAPWIDAFAAYLQEPCEGGNASDVDSQQSVANCASVSARAAATGTRGTGAGVTPPGGLIARFKAHLNARVESSGAPLICKFSDHAAYREDDPRDGGGLVYCPFTQPLAGDTRWVGIAFLRAQKDGARLPPRYVMHCALRVYHTTLPDIADDDPGWRDLRKNCSLDSMAQPNPDRTCGEEIYFPFDLALLQWALTHPPLASLLLSLASDNNLHGLIRLLLGTTKANEARELSKRMRVSILGMLVAAGALIVAGIGLACCCMCSCGRRRLNETSTRMSQACSSWTCPRHHAARTPAHEKEAGASLLDAAA